MRRSQESFRGTDFPISHAQSSTCGRNGRPPSATFSSRRYFALRGGWRALFKTRGAAEFRAERYEQLPLAISSRACCRWFFCRLVPARKGASTVDLERQRGWLHSGVAHNADGLFDRKSQAIRTGTQVAFINRVSYQVRAHWKSSSAISIIKSQVHGNEVAGSVCLRKADAN
jgi:hypothetical protein